MLRAAHAERRKDVELRGVEDRQELGQKGRREEDGRELAQNLQRAEHDFGRDAKPTPHVLPKRADALASKDEDNDGDAHEGDARVQDHVAAVRMARSALFSVHEEARFTRHAQRAHVSGRATSAGRVPPVHASPASGHLRTTAEDLEAR